MTTNETAPSAPRRVETARLVLRPFTLADHPAYARICSDPEVMRFIGAGGPNPPEVTWRVMAGTLGHWEMLGYGIYAMQLRDGPVIGHAGFIDVPGWPGFELAYLVDQPHWRQGYAGEACRALLDVARNTLRKQRIVSLVRPANEPSKQLARSLGAVQEGSVDLLGSPAEVFVYP